MVKYNLQEFKNWLNEDESRKGGIKDWNELFTTYEKGGQGKLGVIHNIKRFSGKKPEEIDKLDDITLFFNFLDCHNNHWHSSCHHHWESFRPYLNIFFEWLNEKNKEEESKVKLVNAQEWFEKQFVDSRKEKLKIKKIIISSSISEDKRWEKNYEWNLYLSADKDCLEGKLDLNEFVNLENLYIGRQKISELDTESCRKLVVVDVDKVNGDEEIKWNGGLYFRAQQVDKVEKEKSELEAILEKFTKRNEELEQEKQELSKKLAEMKLKVKELKEKTEAKIEVLPK